MSLGVSSHRNASHLAGNHTRHNTRIRPEQWWTTRLRKDALSAGALMSSPRNVLDSHSKASPQKLQEYTVWSPTFCPNG